MRTVAVALVLFVLSACAPGPKGELRLGTTTTLQDSGLLDALVADFERRSGYKVRATVQGTGAILGIARRGDVDVILTHEPLQELAFMAEGYGRRRDLVMYNDFILVGPPGDPAGVKGKGLEDAFRAIATARSAFISRGDRSGTDVTEKAAWQRAGVVPQAPWYVESGVGQGQSLVVASERRAYIVTDRATFFGRRTALALDVMVEPQPRLLNLYHLISIDPAKAAGARAAAAEAFAQYLLAADAQRLIGDFGRDRFGMALFVPAAGKRDSEVR